MPRASICKRRIETCARGMRWVRPLRASTEVEPLRAGPATDSPSPEAASVARVGLASKRLEDTPGDVPEPSPLRCSESPRTGGPASDATQPLSHRGAALATGRSDGLPSCSPHLLHLETSARGLGRPSSNRVTVEMGPSTPTLLAPDARPEAETLARSRRFCHLLAPRARDRRVTHLARPEDPLGGRTYESGWALRSPGEHGPASGSGSRPRRRRRPLTPVSDASRERGCLGVKSRRATPLVVARGSTTARRRSRR